MGWNWKNQVREFVQQCARDDHGCLKHSCQSWVPKKEKLSHPFGVTVCIQFWGRLISSGISGGLRLWVDKNL